MESKHERAACFRGVGRHASSAQAVLTIGAVYAGVLVVTEEKAAVALALIAAHGIDTDLLAATIVVLTLIHICEKREKGGEEMSCLELGGHRDDQFLHQLMKGLHRGATQWSMRVLHGIML